MSKLLDTLSEVAFALGTTQQNVSQWKQKGCPHLQTKPYDLDKIRQWANKNIDPSKASRKKVEDRVALLDRQKEIDTEMKELHLQNMRWETALREGKLVWAEDWTKVLTTQAEAFRREVLGMEHQKATEIIGITTREQAAKALHEIAVDILKRLHIGET